MAAKLVKQHQEKLDYRNYFRKTIYFQLKSPPLSPLSIISQNLYVNKT